MDLWGWSGNRRVRDNTCQIDDGPSGCGTPACSETLSPRTNMFIAYIKKVVLARSLRRSSALRKEGDCPMDQTATVLLHGGDDLHPMALTRVIRSLGALGVLYTRAPGWLLCWLGVRRRNSSNAWDSVANPLEEG